MRSLSQFLADYGDSHQNATNQWIHIVCVPLIFASTLGLLWLVPVGNWLGLGGPAAYWLNGATVLGALAGVVYLRLGLGTFVLMTVWFALSVLAVIGISKAGWSLLWTSVAVWVFAWIIQVIGHRIEGKKPSFIEDLVFLLIGPIFVSVELASKLGIPVPAQLHGQHRQVGH
ncbi:MAG: Mpo1-like protein [Marinobacter sp.]|nr:Mpo1-like protein [Marinobacter sp.]